MSGALLVPDTLRAAVGRIADVPAGLADYTTRDDWPACFSLIRARLSDDMNVGQALRWRAAVEDIRTYFAVPELFRRLALAEFAAAAARHIARHPEFRLLPAPEAGGADDGLDEFAARTIFPFLIVRDGRPLSLAKTRVLHQALNMDAAALGLADPIAATPCHIGQPVAVADGLGGTAGALRISADARLVADSWAGASDLVSTGRLTARFDEIATVFAKLQFFLDNADRSGAPRA